MARVFCNGKDFEVPMTDDGKLDVDELRRRANIPPNRALIHQRPTGENVVVRRHGKVEASPYDHFMDVARATRGAIH